MGDLFTFHKENLDPEMSVFSRHAFEDMIHSYYLSGRDFRFICIYVDDYSEHTGMENDPSLVEEFVEFLNGVGNGTNIYHIDRAEFAIEITDPAPGQIDKIIADIRIRFEKPWKIFGRDELFSVSLLSLRLPEDVKAETVFYSVLRQFHDGEKIKSVYTAKDLDIEDIERKHQITVALSRAIEKKTLEMRYTPVYSLSGKKIAGLIATVRFFDDATGYVYDDEIFRFAESGGYIMHVANILFEKTAVFIKENKLQEAGMDFVGIRVYPTMTMHYNLLTRMFEYMDRNGIDKSRVYIMMSESTLANATESFRRTIKHLDEMGGRFCLEEYGGGYTDISTIYDMPIDVISINRRVVADAVSNKSAKLAMESAIDLAHCLDMRTMVSGINDAEYYSMIESVDCDYATGSYFFEQLDEQGFIRALAANDESVVETMDDKSETDREGEAT
jgi:EAL domain-containing protein (putative c-di-GMP-specific phosphodiesterase class I)